jgi:hypothetical protein
VHRQSGGEIPGLTYLEVSSCPDTGYVQALANAQLHLILSAFRVKRPFTLLGYFVFLLAVGCPAIGQPLALFLAIYCACEIVATLYIYRHQHIFWGSK